MKAKRVSITRREQSILQTILSMEIKSDIEYQKIGIEPAFNIEMLKTLYRKIAGFEWKDLG